MKYSSIQALQLALFPLLIVTGLILLVSDAMAQIPASVIIHRSPEGQASRMQITWSAADELRWHDMNEGRLEIMGLKTNITSIQLEPLPDEPLAFQFGVEKDCVVEMLIVIDSLADEEDIRLINKRTNEIITDFRAQKRKEFLTPQFNPADMVFIWSADDDGKRSSSFVIENIYYQPILSSRLLDIGFGTALACHPNAACKTDSVSGLISNAAVRMRLVMEEGIGYCTGSLINNARNDKTPYLLTAYHCQWNFTPRYDMWRFDFDYKSETCPNPALEPQYLSLTGCQLKAGGQASDFLLLLLDEAIPDNFAVTFAGWNRDDTTTPDTSYHVHHPSADIRKFSTSTNKAVIHPNQIGWSEGYNTPANHHFRFEFTEGGHEPGSSGGPVFDEDGFLIGQLHGGMSGCEDESNTFVGRFSKSWNLGPDPSSRLRDWLDPDTTGAMQLSSIENIAAGDLITIEGLLADHAGRPIRNAQISVSGSVTTELMTDDNGHFAIAGINRNGQYVFTPEKTNAPGNGINVIDALAIQKHLLGKVVLVEPWQLIASDVTNNGQISVGDILVIMRLLLGKIDFFPSSPSWRFDPPQVTLEALPAGQTAQIQFTGIKIGDINGNADPSN